MTCGGCAASVKRVTDAGCTCECGCRLGGQDRQDRYCCAPGCREISDRRRWLRRVQRCLKPCPALTITEPFIIRQPDGADCAIRLSQAFAFGSHSECTVSAPQTTYCTGCLIGTFKRPACTLIRNSSSAALTASLLCPLLQPTTIN